MAKETPQAIVPNEQDQVFTVVAGQRAPGAYTPQLDADAALRYVSETIAAGQPAVRRAADKLLPREPSEEIEYVAGKQVDPWELRVNRLTVTPFLLDAVSYTTARILGKDLVLDGGGAKALELWDDANREGDDAYSYLSERCARAFFSGVSLTLVEFPSLPGDARPSSADERRFGLRAFFSSYDAGSLASVEVGRLGTTGRRVLYAELREPLGEDASAAERKTASGAEPFQVRRLWAGDPTLDTADERRYARFDVVRQIKSDGGGSTWRVVSFGPLKPQTDIPLVPHYSDRTGILRGVPAYNDVAHLNLLHVRRSNELDNLIRVVGKPILHRTGVTPADVEAQKKSGVGFILSSTNPAARAEYVEHTGAAIAAIEANLRALESNISTVSRSTMLGNAPGALTATGDALRDAKGTTRIKMWGRNFFDSIDKALYYASLYNEESPATVTHPTDFTAGVAGADAAELALKGQGTILSDETVYEVFRDSIGGPLSDRTWEEEKRRLDEQSKTDLEMVGGDAEATPLAAEPVAAPDASSTVSPAAPSPANSTPEAAATATAL